MAPNAGKMTNPWSWAALLWGAAEAFLFFIVPDILIGWVVLRRGWRAGVLVAVLATAGASIGGAALYALSDRYPPSTWNAVSKVPAVSREMMEQAETDVIRDGWLVAAMKGPLTSTPYKVYAALAPRHGASLPAWAAAAFPIRLPRFLLVVAGFALIGRVLEGRVSRRMLLAGFTLGWVLFYGWFWLSHPG